MVGVRGFEPATPASRRQFFQTVAPLNLPFTHSDPLEADLTDTFRPHQLHKLSIYDSRNIRDEMSSRCDATDVRLITEYRG